MSLRSDQWDMRFNVDGKGEADQWVETMKMYCANKNVKYCHISGIEIGDNPSYDSYGKAHIHVALVLDNHTSRNSIIKQFAGNNDSGWYIAARDKSKSITGWVAYHAKERTKIDPTESFLFQYGKLPGNKRTITTEQKNHEEDEKTLKKYEAWQRKKYLIQHYQWELLDYEFPGFIYSSMGQSMKREIMKQSNDEHTKTLSGDLQNFIIWGPSGSGKSSSIAYLYPNCYKKQKGSQYWDGYDKTNPNHQVVWIDEMSKETLKCLTGKVDGGFEFLKELADRYAVTVDEKYTKGYKIRPKKIIITMNEHPTTLLPDRAIEVNKAALFRKFNIIYVTDWLVKNDLKLTPSGVQPTVISQFDVKPTGPSSSQKTKDNNRTYRECGTQTHSIYGQRGTGCESFSGNHRETQRLEENHGYTSLFPSRKCSPTKSSLCKILPCEGRNCTNM